MAEEKPQNQPQETSELKIEDNHVLAAIGYIWLLFLVPLLLKKDDQFCQFHAKQGLVLFILSLIVIILGGIPVLGWLLIMPIGWIVVAILALLGFINALRGREWEMPVLGKYAQKIKI